MGGPLRDFSPSQMEIMKRPVLLIVDDERDVREALALILKDEYEITMAESSEEALKAVRSGAVDMILLDINLPGVDGLRTLELIKKVDESVGVIMLSASNSAQQAVSALKKGAYDYITKPFETEDLRSTLSRYAERFALKEKVLYLENMQDECYGLGEIISKSPKMMPVFEIIRKVAGTPSNVLITGESGTGKELVARAIHSLGDRRDKPFVTVNCGAVPAELIESELFGHERGSFTGAHARKIGKFEYADSGTIFLDEISTLPMVLQSKLLRILQERSFERVGSNTPMKVDIRIVAATNLDLEKEVKKGAFREDLYFRLNVVPIDLPPLRDRTEDIPLLVAHFTEKHCVRCSRKPQTVSERALKAMQAYQWPGNVRELENLVERLVVLSIEGKLIDIEDLPLTMFYTGGDGVAYEAPIEFKEACRAFEKRYILDILATTKWNRVDAARKLRIHRNTLLLKMRELGIKAPKRGREDLR